MPLVHNESVEKNEGYGRAINQVFDLYIRPYFKDRGHRFEWEKFRTAIIELFDDERRPRIRTGTDVPIEIVFDPQKRTVSPADVGKSTSIDLREIKKISWHEGVLDNNSAKVLVMRFNKDWWILNFDFRYNQGTARQKLKRAQEFLSSCKTLARKRELSPHTLLYLLWSAAELIIDAKLSLHAQRTRRNHRERQEKLKSQLGAAIFSPEFSTTFLSLSQVKNGARYGDVNYSKKYDRKSVRSMISTIEKEIPEI